MVTNLIDNAVKYSDADAPVEVEVAEADGGVTLAVRDRGFGLDEEASARLFEAFGRGLNAEHIPGLGLGLFISHQIVERHGGRIDARGRSDGRGSEFTLWLPGGAASMTAPGRILVVEDDESLREALLEVLGDEGHEVRAAKHGADALEALDGWEPELLVLDLMMPVMDAFEFREHQRRREAALGARVLVLSAARDLGGAADRLGADAYLAKPFRLDEMLSLVDRLLDDHRAGDAAGR